MEIDDLKSMIGSSEGDWVADFEIAEGMLREFIRKIHANWMPSRRRYNRVMPRFSGPALRIHSPLSPPHTAPRSRRVKAHAC